MASGSSPALGPRASIGTGLALATAIVGLGFLGSRLLGILRTVAIANAFGSSPELGAYNVAFKVPDLIFQVLAGATLGSAFIPVFARMYRQEGEERAWRLASAMLNIVTAGTAALCLLAFILAPLLVPWFAPDLGKDVGRHDELTGQAVTLDGPINIRNAKFAEDPAPLDPLDVSSLDGFLCGVIVQPRRVDRERWLPLVTDVDGRPLPAGFDARRLHSLVGRRETELRRAIERREWFDPRVFELEGGEEGDAVYPWVAGFAAAMESFPELIGDGDELAAVEPLALIYRHLDADDLEDAEALLAEIESLEPPSDLAESVEGLVRATLLLADVGRERSRR